MKKIRQIAEALWAAPCLLLSAVLFSYSNAASGWLDRGLSIGAACLLLIAAIIILGFFLDRLMDRDLW